jgi:hypothetical protein
MPTSVAKLWGGFSVVVLIELSWRLAREIEANSGIRTPFNSGCVMVAQTRCFLGF